MVLATAVIAWRVRAARRTGRPLFARTRAATVPRRTLRTLRTLGLLSVLVALVALGLLALRAVRDAQPGIRDTGELSRAISDIEGYEGDCGGLTVEERDFGSGSATTFFCSVSRNGRPVGPDGAITVVLVEPVDAMDEFVARYRETTERPFHSIVGDNWVIPGMVRYEELRKDLLAGLDGAREDLYGTYPP